jgi:hypothetical protein
MAKMDYEDAKRIRNKDYSLGKLITSNIRQGAGAGSAIKEAFKEKFDVGTRTKAKITGIKEKFDPLNIAKFLTGGSNFAPALLGRLTGRSQKDINYFSGGRAKPYESATKIGQVEGDESGLTEILDKIYNFMKKNQEDDIKHQELQNNHREEEMQKDAKRHSDLLKALAKLTGGKEDKTATKVEEKDSGSFIDQLMDAFGVGRSLFGMLRAIGPLLLNPVTLGILGLIAVGGLLAYLIANDKDPEGTSKMMANMANPDAAMAEAILGPKTSDEIVLGRKNKLLGDRTGEDWSLFNDDPKKKAYLEKMGFDEKTGTTKEERDKGIIGFDSDGDPIYKKKEGATATPVSPQTNAGGSSTTTESQTPATPANPTTPPSAESTNPGQQLVNATNENNNAKLADLTSSPATNTVSSSSTNVAGKSSSSKQPLPPVRNLEDTFQRMIMNSTRVV